MIRRLLSTETGSRANARRSLAVMQLRRRQTEQAQAAVDEAAAHKAAAAGG